jgi:isopentenyl diphosphate isomerase/L-lactate dehydrogenase-like FMN-dependent dehydrogenase
MFANIYGTPGVQALIKMLKMEIETSLSLAGQADTSKLDLSYINTKQIENIWF